ncbi:MAG: site-specific DNA-methyltransferase [candidate division WOR-3 bacterium]
MTYSSNCWYFPPEKKRDHPAPFPLELPMRLIKFYTWEGDWIIDPFVGSGTTLLAALKLKRNAVGIDISENYCQIARKRIEYALKGKSRQKEFEF